MDTEMRVAKLHQIGWYFEGEAEITLWGGTEGTIDMKPWQIEDEFDEAEMMKGINDGQFGCQSIDGAVVNVYRLYENGYKEYEDDFEYDSNQLQKFQDQLKKGI